MKVYTLTLTIEDTLVADDLRAAWDEFKTRIMDGAYGPTFRDITEGAEVTEEAL